MDYYAWTSVGQSGSVLGSVGANPTSPGVHGDYQTTTAKCGICHSVHRAKAGGVKLLNTDTATCGGCHIAGTSTVTNVVIAWGTAAAPLAGPHSSASGSCTSRACHATSPHGANGSDYALFRSKLLTDAVDVQVADAAADPTNSGVTAAILAGTGGTASERDAVMAGYTCASEGCHEQTQLSVLKAGWAELRENLYPLGNVAGNQVLKTGHMTGSAASSEGASAYAPIAGCISCHDQTDLATRSGYTFPHAQRATGSGAGTQTYLWYNIAGSTTDTEVPMTDSNMKSFDGACLKCHRTDTQGIGLTH
jgi:predicted CXXCH cytochrome family protein